MTHDGLDTDGQAAQRIHMCGLSQNLEPSWRYTSVKIQRQICMRARAHQELLVVQQPRRQIRGQGDQVHERVRSVKGARVQCPCPPTLRLRCRAAEQPSLPAGVAPDCAGSHAHARATWRRGLSRSEAKHGTGASKTDLDCDPSGRTDLRSIKELDELLIDVPRLAPRIAAVLPDRQR